jgi:hypothetical protein
MPTQNLGIQRARLPIWLVSQCGITMLKFLLSIAINVFDSWLLRKSYVLVLWWAGFAVYRRGSFVPSRQ